MTCRTKWPDLTSESKVRWVITVSAVGLLLIKLLCPETGARIDAVAFGIFLVALVPWAHIFLRSLKIFGAEIEWQEADQAVRAQNNQMEEAKFDPSVAAAGEKSQMAPENLLKDLAKKYVQTRQSMSSSAERTGKMSSIFRSMIEVGKGIEAKPLELSKDLSAMNPGRNLAAISVIYAQSCESLIDATLECVLKSHQPFVQYWGLMTIWKMTRSSGPQILSLKSQNEIRALQATISSRTDRGRIVASMIAQMDGKI